MRRKVWGMWKSMEGDEGRCGERCGGSKVWGEVREMWKEMWAVGEDKGRCGKKYGGCEEV